MYLTLFFIPNDDAAKLVKVGKPEVKLGGYLRFVPVTVRLRQRRHRIIKATEHFLLCLKHETPDLPPLRAAARRLRFRNRRMPSDQYRHVWSLDALRLRGLDIRAVGK